MQKIALLPLSDHAVFGDQSPLNNEQEHLTGAKHRNSAFSQDTYLSSHRVNGKKKRAYNSQSFTEKMYYWNGFLKQKFQQTK